MVVEMVEKVVVRMGCLVFLGVLWWKRGRRR